MSQYRTFTASDAVAYAQQFGGLSAPEALVSAQEVGDGNLNLVFGGILAADARSRAPRSPDAGGALSALPGAHG